MWAIWDRKDRFFITVPMTRREAEAWQTEHLLPRYVIKRVTTEDAKGPDRSGNSSQGSDNYLDAGVDGDVTASIPREGIQHHDGRAPDDPRIA
ncbi:hypothetical protein FNH13_08365 [Ornithinimicrobium ciconiae]|uniref:Uncharacterized protein n=1 Tax=Ornithinimicrobium ciconiae TaxID=2594265 RepID=A0A516GA02_9MICO|nr:hypothetical protein [Ornithinimicrobium ciconiae]QDO88354.1 hypothetical protein FNH13_08365 [Ornithinimicrobium ciconiae]